MNNRTTERESVTLPVPSLPSFQDEVDLRQSLRVIRRRKLTIISTILLFTGLAALAVLQTTRKYTAEAVLVVDAREPQVVNMPAVAPTLRPGEAIVRSEVDVVTSKATIERVVDGLDLMNDPEFNSRLSPRPPLLDRLAGLLPAAWRPAPSAAPPAAAPVPDATARAAVIEAVRGGLKVNNESQSVTLLLSYTATDPAKAAAIANAFADAYLGAQVQAKQEATRRATAWLGERLEGLSREVQATEQAVQAFRERHQLIEARGGTLTTQQLAELSTQLVMARAEAAQAEARLRDVRQAATGRALEGASAIVASPLIQVLRQQETEMRRREAELSTQYGPRHPRIINLRAERADLQRKLDEEIQRVVAALASDAAVARARIQSLEATLADLETRSGAGEQAGVRLRELERQALATRTLYESFLTRSKETAEQPPLQQPDARLVSRAQAPSQPSSPNVPLILGLGVVCGGFTGLLLAFAQEKLDGGFRSVDQVEQATGQSVLGLIPAITGLRRPRPEDYVLHKPKSAFSEAVRSVITAIEVATPKPPAAKNPTAKPPGRTILVTSSAPGEGKTAFCLSLARTLAATGRTALLIDADLRRPRVGPALGDRKDAVDLAELLRRDTPSALQDAIQTDAPSGAYYIAARPGADYPQSLLSSLAMKRLLKTVAAHYDVVIVDTPPIIAVSDATVLAEDADVCLFLVRWAVTPRETVAEGIRQLAPARCRNVAMVLTQVDLDQHARYTDGGYGRYGIRYQAYYRN